MKHSILNPKGQIVNLNSTVVNTNSVAVNTNSNVVKINSSVVKTNRIVVNTNSVVVKTNRNVVNTNRVVVKINRVVVKINRVVIKINRDVVKINSPVVNTNSVVIKTNNIPFYNDNCFKNINHKKADIYVMMAVGGGGGDGFIPGPDSEFNIWQDNLIKYIIENQAELGIPDEAIELLITNQGKWVEIFSIVNNPDTASPPKFKTKKQNNYGIYARKKEVQKHIPHRDLWIVTRATIFMLPSLTFGSRRLDTDSGSKTFHPLVIRFRFFLDHFFAR